MAKRLERFPEEGPSARRKYPWPEWTDGGVWEITRGEDYDVPTENMRVNLHLKAEALVRKVRTRKVSDERGEGLIFEFLESEEMKEVTKEMDKNPKATALALETLHEDATEIYERARQEVTIPRRDGSRQKYAAIRFKRQIDKGHEEGMLVPAVASIVRKPTRGFGHLEDAERPDLMLETLVLDEGKPYHRLFSVHTVEAARKRMADYRERHL
jgi:uncharacterized protein (DUF885 family)